MSKLRALFKLADAALSTGDAVMKQFRGKTPAEAGAFLKDNFGRLRSPTTFMNLQKALSGQSADDIKKVLMNGRKHLSAEDALALAEILTSDTVEKKLPEYLEKKVKDINEKERQNPTTKRTPKRGK